MNRALILGGYGNFGKRIARLLVRQHIPVIIAGRDRRKAEAIVQELSTEHAEAAAIDIRKDLSSALELLAPKLVINTCGPFQTANYDVARTCIRRGVAYVDLADAREFVTGIGALNEEALANNVAVVSGASTVPGITSAVLEHFLPDLPQIDALDFGITPGQKAERGLATTAAILGYVGKRLKPAPGSPLRYGWQDLHMQSYPVIGRRLMANCEVPDLDLLPERYGVRKIRFSAGMENPALHLGIWALSFAVRSGLPINLAKHAPFLLKASRLFDFLGSADGGMHVLLEGHDGSGQAKTASWFIIALDGDGPFIPAAPAVALTKKILAGELAPGATPCVGLVSLPEYLAELAHLKVSTFESVSGVATQT